MTRTGSCLQCGACCRLIGFAVDYRIPGLIEWLSARGWEYRQGMAIAEHPCPHVSAGNNCDLHADGKPEVCERFPNCPEELLDGCGFGFEEEGIGGGGG